ncbi:MAG TPA: dihydrofolate reductase family protein [Gemmatimonadaceae bacterium]|jgi:dihydrofolate reductase
MRRLTINTFLTLDGVIQAPGAPDEDTSNGFKHGGWIAKYWDDVMGQIMDQTMRQPFDLLLGRKTYDIFAAYWPSSTQEPVASAFNKATKYIASRTLEKGSWAPTQVLKGDVAQEVAKLKRGEGPELQVHGSANFAQTLIKNNLIDTYRLWFFPLVLGTGKRLFADGTVPAALKLTDSETSTTGVTIATFEPAGAIEYGRADEAPEQRAARRETVAASGRR